MSGLVKDGIRECSGESLSGIPAKVGLFRLDPLNSPGMGLPLRFLGPSPLSLSAQQCIMLCFTRENKL